ncbi:hypothetical protein [Mycobacterium sp. E136]|uniref:hypothetical protein n=1 Tax=Mycobacterium sp. E136 TaxID=1834125 RepID=UPI000B33BE78|nr:hypothetical protein [Mycobacterium sp. E136]
MTALQDWLTHRPMHPRTLKAMICDTLRLPTSQPAEQDARPAEPALLQPGLERC